MNTWQRNKKNERRLLNTYRLCSFCRLGFLDGISTWARNRHLVAEVEVREVVRGWSAYDADRRKKDAQMHSQQPWTWGVYASDATRSVSALTMGGEYWIFYWISLLWYTRPWWISDSRSNFFNHLKMIEMLILGVGWLLEFREVIHHTSNRDQWSYWTLG